jgi:hypothetical protein
MRDGGLRDWLSNLFSCTVVSLLPVVVHGDCSCYRTNKTDNCNTKHEGWKANIECTSKAFLEKNGGKAL